MSENRLPRSYNGDLSCPGKVFLLGEYAVLDRRPAVIAAVSPRFKLSFSAPQTPIHPESPSGKLLDKLLRKANHSAFPEFHFEDSTGGGLGASSAQFALLWRATYGTDDKGGWVSAWKLYRELTADSELPPSGADLIAQYTGGLVKITLPEDLTETPSVKDLASGFDGASLLVFSTSGIPGRKIPTHEHLETLARSGFPRSHSGLLKDLESLTETGARALASLRDSPENHSLLSETIQSFAKALHLAGLEASATTDDRKWFMAQPGVTAVKGSGALQADALIVVLNPGDPGLLPGGPLRKKLIALALERGLRLIADGLNPEIGITP